MAADDYEMVEVGDVESDDLDDLEATAKARELVVDDADDNDDDSSLGKPTDEEKDSLRRVADNIPLATFTIVVVELCERFSMAGLYGVFQNYLQNPLPPGGNGAGAPASVDDPYPAGALGLGQQKATAIQSMFSSLGYILPLFGAIIADAKWGRFKTICYSCFFYFAGLVVITATSFPVSLRNGGGLPGWILGSLIIAIGTGGIKANVSPLIVDQYTKSRSFVRTTVSGERVIVDPNVTITRIYNLFYWSINLGSMSSSVTTVIERRVGFWAAYLLPTCIFLATPTVLALSSRLYRKVPPRGSILVEVYRIISLTLRGFWSNPMHYFSEMFSLPSIFGARPHEGYESIEGHETASLWDRAKPSYIQATGQQVLPSQITWDDAFVDEVKRTAKACRVFLFYPLYWISYAQINNNLISMAGMMTTHGIPNDIMQNFNPLALILLIPVIDMFVYPALSRLGIAPRPIFRIWLGFMFAASALAYSAVLQYYLYQTNPCGKHISTCSTPSSIHVAVQIPSYVLIAVSEIFASITGLEYAYNKAPKRMKSVVMSFYMLTNATASIISALIAPLAADPTLVEYYAGVGLVTFVAGNAFYFCFGDRDRHEEAENAIGQDR